MDGDLKENSSIRPIVATEKLFGQCFEATKISNDALIPVGGGSIFSGETDIAVVGDFENFKDFYDEASKTAAGYNLMELSKWLSKQGVEIDPKLFAVLFAFTRVYEKRYPRNPEAQEERLKVYSRQKEVKLSELFDNGTVECAEISALAQSFLQEEGVKSSFFSGDVLWNKGDEFSEKHSFIVIPQGEKHLLYDPRNPTSTTQGIFPSIYTAETNFGTAVRSNQKRFVESKNILNKKLAYFGVNNGTNVTEQSFYA